MRIVIADDHALFRGGLRLQLADLAQDANILDVGTLDEAEALLAQSGAADVFLMDLDLPGMSWRTCVSDIRVRYPDMRLVVVSGDDRPETIREALAAGVHGYIPKQEQPDVFCAALKLVLSGGTYFPTAMMAEMVASERPVEASSTTTQESAPAVRLQTSHPLTDRQMDVLLLMSEGLSNKGIARQLGVTEGTVKLHVAAILRHLGAANRTQAVTLAREGGVLAH